jgi:hypothetical protein
MSGSYPRDMIGYGALPPHPQWPNDARIALQFVINDEEGAENSVLPGDPLPRTRSTPMTCVLRRLKGSTRGICSFPILKTPSTYCTAKAKPDLE